MTRSESNQPRIPPHARNNKVEDLTGENNKDIANPNMQIHTAIQKIPRRSDLHK